MISDGRKVSFRIKELRDGKSRGTTNLDSSDWIEPSETIFGWEKGGNRGRA